MTARASHEFQKHLNTCLIRDMLLKAISTLFLLCFLRKCSTVQSTVNDVAATCNAEPAIEGQQGVIHITFNEQIDFNRDFIFLYLKNEVEKDILHCGGIDKPPPAECIVLPAFVNRFKTEGLTGHYLTLLITEVTPELAGEYVLSGYVNGTPVNQSKCNMTISKYEGKESREESSGTMSIVVPVLAILLLIAIVFVAVVVHRIRQRGRGYTLATSEQTNGCADEGRDKNTEHEDSESDQKEQNEAAPLAPSRPEVAAQ